MPNFLDWVEQEGLDKTKPWLILGKGPSFSRLPEIDSSPYYTAALNHAGRELKTDFTHIIDLEVLEESGAEIFLNCKFLIMPSVPHKNMKADDQKPLPYWIEQLPLLQRFADENRLLSYELSGSGLQTGSQPKVEAVYFSSEALLGLLGLAGIKIIRSLGIDGGASYAGEFADLHENNCLANGQPSFDLQFKQFPKIINKFGLDYACLAEQFPMEIFIGASKSEAIPAKVLAYSIKKHASSSVRCRFLSEETRPYKLPRAKENQPRTPFSFQRFLIPELMNYKGKAIYLDSDMLVLEDIAKLWRMPFDWADLLCTNAFSPAQKAVQYSVMLLDCEKLTWNIDNLVKALDDGLLGYEALVHKMAAAKNPAARIPPTWNFLDNYQGGSTALIHYTDMRKQPWLSIENKAAAIWVMHLREAVKLGYISMAELQNEVELGHLRPSLLNQVELEIDDPLGLPHKLLKADDKFIPKQLSHAQSW